MQAWPKRKGTMFHRRHFHRFRTGTSHTRKRRTLLQWKYRTFSQLKKRTNVNNKLFDFMSHRLTNNKRVAWDREWQCGVRWTKGKLVYPILLSTLQPHTSCNRLSSSSLYAMHDKPNQAGQVAAPLRAGPKISVWVGTNTELRTWDQKICLQLLEEKPTDEDSLPPWWSSTWTGRVWWQANPTSREDKPGKPYYTYW